MIVRDALRVNIVYLGVSAAAPAHGRGLPSLLVEVEGRGYLFDVGEGTQARLQDAGISIHGINAVFVTHLHGDHFFGLPGLLQFMTLSGRTRPLTIVGPRALAEYILCAERATSHLRSYEIIFRRVSGGVVYSDDLVIVEAFPVCHSIESYGYKLYTRPKLRVNVEKLRSLGLKPGPYLSRLRKGEPVVVDGRLLRPEDVLEVEPPRVTIVYTGDTRPCITTVEAARSATLLVHDSTFSEIHAEEAREKKHSTAREAGIVARLAGAECLALFHISARYRDPGILVEEARRGGARCVYAAAPYMLHAVDL